MLENINAFFQSMPTTVLIALIIFLVIFVFKKTIKIAVKIALYWIIINFLLTLIFGLGLPSLADFVDTFFN